MPPRTADERRRDAAGKVAAALAAGAPPATAAAAGGAAVAAGTAGMAAIIDAAWRAIRAVLGRISAFRTARTRRALLAQGVPPAGLEEVLSNERERERAYLRRAEGRIRAGLEAALRAPDASAQAAAIESVLRREQQYARQRSLVHEQRVRGEVDYLNVRDLSPQGGYWELGVAANHTPECISLAGRFWPHEVLALIHPPLHPGCACKVRTLGEALSAGLMTPGEIPSRAEALRRAQPIIDFIERERAEDRVREGLAEEIDAALLEAVWREWLHPRDEYGRFKEKVAGLFAGAPHPERTVRLDPRVRVTADRDGTYRVVNHETVISGFEVPEDAARAAADASARRKEPESIGGTTRYRDFDHYLAAKKVDPDEPHEGNEDEIAAMLVGLRRREEHAQRDYEESGHRFAKRRLVALERRRANFERKLEKARAAAPEAKWETLRIRGKVFRGRVIDRKPGDPRYGTEERVLIDWEGREQGKPNPYLEGSKVPVWMPATELRRAVDRDPSHVGGDGSAVGAENRRTMYFDSSARPGGTFGPEGGWTATGERDPTAGDIVAFDFTGRLWSAKPTGDGYRVQRLYTDIAGDKGVDETVASLADAEALLARWNREWLARYRPGDMVETSGRHFPWAPGDHYLDERETGANQRVVAVDRDRGRLHLANGRTVEPSRDAAWGVRFGPGAVRAAADALEDPDTSSAGDDEAAVLETLATTRRHALGADEIEVEAGPEGVRAAAALASQRVARDPAALRDIGEKMRPLLGSSLQDLSAQRDRIASLDRSLQQALATRPSATKWATIARLRRELEEAKAEVQEDAAGKIADALARVRPGYGQGRMRPRASTSRLRALAHRAVGLLPREWVDDNPEPTYRAVQRRGEYHSWNNVLKSIENDPAMMLHEFGHWVEAHVPGVREAERAFYEERTAGEAAVLLSRLRPGYGYRRDERSRPDRWYNPYVGKDYGGRDYEVLTMGLEAVFYGAQHRRRARQDREHVAWTLGLLVTL